MSADSTKEVLEQLLAKLYEKQAVVPGNFGNSYLQAGDGKFLGKVTENSYDRESLLNEYGPYGSPYSPTSIFNSYSVYGSPYGAYSVNNPYCTNPPLLFINGENVGRVTANTNVPRRIPVEGFLYSLKNDVSGLLHGRFPRSESEIRQRNRESFIEAEDGSFLGKINPNPFDQESIFNKYGPYGNVYSQSSIFNKYSKFGNQFNHESPFNQYSNSPPKIFVRGRFFAFLTKNKNKNPRLDPDDLFNWAEQNISRFG